jgi:LacI family transcriptional regulator
MIFVFGLLNLLNMIKILLLTDFSTGYSRSLLKGIVKYSREFGPWSFYRMPSYFREIYGDEGIVKWAKEWGANAIIAQFSQVDVNILNQLNIPIIIQNYKDRNDFISNLTGDYFGTGSMAAKFFLLRGYKHFAYYGFNNAVWMRERKDGFVVTIEEKGFKVFLYSDHQTQHNVWEFNHEILKNWLENLPKPIALFACDDSHALQITEICKMYGIRIPNDIAVLGVDNDDLLCNISDPNISSIELDVDNGGYLAGKLIHDFLENNATPPVNIIIKPIRIVLRQSTEKYAVSNIHIENVMKFIEQRYMDDINVDSIINIVPFSRRVLEKLFKKEIGMTIYQYILIVRIDFFSNLLVTTNIPLVDAAFQVGFFDYKNVSRIFIKEKKMTPYQYRKAYKI